MLRGFRANGVKKATEYVRNFNTVFYKSFNKASEQKILAKLAQMYYENIPADQQPAYMAEVLKKYKGIDKKILEQLYTMLDNPLITSKTLLFSQIDMAFFESYISNVGLFIDKQIQSLNRNYFYYYNLNQVREFQSTFSARIDTWLKMNPIDRLRNSLN